MLNDAFQIRKCAITYCSVTVVLWDFCNEKKFKHVPLLIKLL